MASSSYVRRRKTKPSDRVDLSPVPISCVTPSWKDLVRTRCSIRWYLKAIKEVSVRDVHVRRLEATPFSKESNCIIYRSSSGNFCTVEQLEDARRGGVIVDDVLDAYLDILIRENQSKKSRHKCGFLSVYAQNKFNDDPSTASHEDLKQFEKFLYGVDILNLSLYFMVVCCDVHWFLVVLDISGRCFKTYNSRTRHRRDDSAVKTLVGWMKRYMSDMLMVANVDSWKIEKIVDIPKQAPESLDCTIFTLQYAEHLTRRLQFTFSQREMRKLREMIVNRIYEEGEKQRSGD